MKFCCSSEDKDLVYAVDPASSGDVDAAVLGYVCNTCGVISVMPQPTDRNPLSY